MHGLPVNYIIIILIVVELYLPIVSSIRINYHGSYVETHDGILTTKYRYKYKHDNINIKLLKHTNTQYTTNTDAQRQQYNGIHKKV